MRDAATALSRSVTAIGASPPDGPIDAVFRFDAGARQGLGHAVRCGAIASTLQALGWRVNAWVGAETLAATDFPAPCVVAGPGHEPDERHRAWPWGCDVCVVDHYELGEDFERGLRPWARRVAILDDRPTRRHDGALLFDPTPGRDPTAYKNLMPQGAILGLGPRLAPLRAAFAAARVEALARRDGRPVRRVMIAAGGTDPDDATGFFLAALGRMSFRPVVDVVLGHAAPALDRYRQAEREGRLALHVDIGGQTMAALMADSDLALGAASSSSWERCCLGLPSVVVTTADNQRDVAKSLHEAGAAYSLGALSELDEAGVAGVLSQVVQDASWRRDASIAAAGLCDGLGTWRMACALAGEVETEEHSTLRLRPVAANDRDRLLSWAREPGTRDFARHPAVPTDDEHARWFAGIMRFDSSLLFLAELDDEPIGSIRFDRDRPLSGEFEVSLLLAARKRGQGLGAKILRLGRQLLRHRTLVAWIDPRNRPSRAIFGRCGYVASGANEYRQGAL